MYKRQLQHCAIAGEALNPEVYNKFYEATGIQLREAFGQTETTVVPVSYIHLNRKEVELHLQPYCIVDEMMCQEGKQQ